MNETEKLISEIDGVLRACGDEPLGVSSATPAGEELRLLQSARDAYLARLRTKKPLYRLLPADMIPDMFLQALKSREAELQPPGA